MRNDIFKNRKISDSLVSQSRPLIDSPQQKLNLLYYGDSPTVPTGFGIVAKHLLRGLYNTGKYNIYVIGINQRDGFYSKEEYPYQIIPAKSASNPDDIYGFKLFSSSIVRPEIDICIVQNDVFIAEQLTKQIQTAKLSRLSNKQKPLRVALYYPVDCKFSRSTTSITYTVDKSVCYSEFGKDSTLQFGGRCTDVINLGVDTSVFYPIAPEQRSQLRRDVMKLDDGNTYVVTCVNRNSPRKDVAKTIYCFSEFHKHVPNSVLYLHMSLRDRGAGTMQVIDLTVPISELGLDSVVRYPADFDPGIGVPSNVLNLLYNCSDMYLTTHLGEGWGIGMTEAMACGVPVVAPDNTIADEMFGSEHERGYIYLCKEQAYIDLQGYRPAGRIEDIVDSMMRCYSEKDCPVQTDKLTLAIQFAKQHDWRVLQQRWITLVDEMMALPCNTSVSGDCL